MLPSILLRGLFALGIILLGLSVYRLVTRSILNRRHSSSASGLFEPGRPAILYFTTPDCAACKTVQEPALAQIKQTLGDRLQIIEVNAYEKPELAKEWGVMSVPTTFIIDAGGSALTVNYGVTRAEKLMDQLCQNHLS